MPRNAEAPPHAASAATPIADSPPPGASSSLASGADEDWKAAMRQAVRSAAELFAELELDPAQLPQATQAAADFPVVVPRPYLDRIRKADPRDPLLLQVLPTGAELQPAPGFVADPLDEANFSPAPGLLQKYAGRALLVLTGTCAVHCRYCFRRSFPYDERPRSWAEWEPAFRQIEADETIREVLVSGGDPLSLVDETLERLVRRLESIAHLDRLRIHTRLPIVVPARVTRRLVALLKSSRLKPVVVVHANHPRELDGATAEALARLRSSGAILLNQSVLLAGVNDDADVLAELSERLLQSGTLPYYLHQLDRVAGADRFEVPVSRGQAIVQELRARLPGYAVPRYVREVPGAASKLPVE